MIYYGGARGLIHHFYFLHHFLPFRSSQGKGRASCCALGEPAWLLAGPASPGGALSQTRIGNPARRLSQPPLGATLRSPASKRLAISRASEGRKNPPEHLPERFRRPSGSPLGSLLSLPPPSFVVAVYRRSAFVSGHCAVVVPE